MHSAAVDFRFRRLTGLTVLLAFLFALSRLGGTQNTTYSHGTSTCLAENDTHGFRLVLTKIDRCGANLYPRLEIEIRKLPIRVQKIIVIGPDNWRSDVSLQMCHVSKFYRAKSSLTNLRKTQRQGLRPKAVTN